MKDKLVILLVIWQLMVLIGLIVCYFMGAMTTGTYYLGLIGCGIWFTLINMCVNKE